MNRDPTFHLEGADSAHVTYPNLHKDFRVRQTVYI